MLETESNELIMYCSQYLNKDDSEDSLHRLLDYENLKKLFIIHDRKMWKYLVFNTSSEYFVYRKNIPSENRYHHEIIWGDLPQRVKFDIDATLQQIQSIPNKDIKYNTYGDIQEKAESIIKHIAHVIVETFIEEYREHLPYKPTVETDILITDSSGKEKISFHIILVHFKLKNNMECKCLTTKICEKLPISYEDIIDRQVNKSVQTFRIQGSLSRNGMRCKRISQISNIVEDGLIQDAQDCDEIINNKYDHNKELKHKNYLSPENLVNIIEKVSEKWPEFAKFRDERDGFLNFDRLLASYCELCDKKHERDNTLMIKYKVDSANGAILLSYGCRHNNQDHLNPFYTINPQEYNRINALKKLAIQIKERMDEPKYVFSRYDERQFGEKLEIAEENMRELPTNYDTLFIRAGMKMGKTKALKTWIKEMDKLAFEYWESNKQGKEFEAPSICILSFRITFTTEMHSKLEGFNSYTELKGPLHKRNANRLIIQIESLHRISGVYDIVILDESESIIGQFNSPMVRSIPIADAHFQALITKAKKVICMDAYLGERTIEIIKRMRNLQNTYLYHNYYKNAQDYTYDIGDYRNNGYFLKKISDTLNTKVIVRTKFILVRAVKKYLPVDLLLQLTEFCSNEYRKKNIAVISNSRSDLNAIHQYILNKHDDIKHSDIEKYTSTTPIKIKEGHMRDVNTYWQKRVILYTPTVTAGISFEKKWFDKIFGVFKNDNSCDVLTCIQMLGRIRNLFDKHIIIALEIKNKNCSIAIDAIKRDIEKNRYNLMEKLPNNIIINPEYIPIKDDEFILDYRIEETNYWYIWAYNTKMANISRRKFVEQFMECILSTGATINIYDKEDEEMYKMITNIKKEHRRQEAESIALSKLPSSEELEEILTKLDEEEVLSEPERMMKAKQKLKTVYDINDSSLDMLDDTDFIMMYNHPKKFEVYRNLKEITVEPTFKESLAKIKTNELRKHQQANDSLYKIVNIKPKYDLHKSTVDLLHMLGIFSFSDSEKIIINEEILEEIMQKNSKLIDNICKIHLRFSPNIKCRSNDVNYEEVAIKECSAILLEMYGHILKKNKKNKIYMLNNKSKFNISNNNIYITKDIYQS